MKLKKQIILIAAICMLFGVAGYSLNNQKASADTDNDIEVQTEKPSETENPENTAFPQPTANIFLWLLFATLTIFLSFFPVVTLVDTTFSVAILLISLLKVCLSSYFNVIFFFVLA